MNNSVNVDCCFIALSVLINESDKLLVCVRACVRACLFVCFCTGPSGVGVTELKRRLLISDPEHFSASVPCELI